MRNRNFFHLGLFSPNALPPPDVKCDGPGQCAPIRIRRPFCRCRILRAISAVAVSLSVGLATLGSPQNPSSWQHMAATAPVSRVSPFKNEFKGFIHISVPHIGSHAYYISLLQMPTTNMQRAVCRTYDTWAEHSKNTFVRYAAWHTLRHTSCLP